MIPFREDDPLALLTRPSTNAKTPFELRESGKGPLQSTPQTAQAELIEASFRRASTVPYERGIGARLPMTFFLRDVVFPFRREQPGRQDDAS
jgi:hypothetical protein